MTPKSVAIVGLAASTAKFARHSKAEEIWTVNRAWEVTLAGKQWLGDQYQKRGFMLPRIDRLYDVHPREYLQQYYPRQWDWLTTAPRPYPIYMPYHYPEVINLTYLAVPELAKDLFYNLRRGSKHNPVFTSGISYALGHAIQLGVPVIELYGLEMSRPHEYLLQRPGLAIIVGIALGRGSRVILPVDMPILAPKLYGLEFVHVPRI